MDAQTNNLRLAAGQANSTPDAELVRSARRGDKRAFIEIVARHQAMVTGIALGILKDFAASEDAAQEAFLTAWRKIHDLQDPERLRGWLGQIARNAALGYLRRQHGGESLDEIAALPDEAPPPDALAASEEEAALVREALEKLPENYRLPLILFYREGQSVRAVAEALDISEDAVKQRLARGREMLRDRVAGVIETVLKKTSPSSVFTMSIAVAIGALTAPTIIAATAFGAAAATTTASTATATSVATAAPASATTTSTLISFMSTTKGLVATAAFVTGLCIPVGYQLAPSSEAKLTQPSASIEKPTHSTAAPNFAESALFAEWRRLHELHGTNAAAMPNLYKAIADLQDPFRRRAFRAALIAEWVQVDPQGGLSFFIRGKDSAQRKQFFQEWLDTNPRAAVEALFNEPGYERLAQEFLVEIARKVPDQVLQIINDIPKPDNHWDTSISGAVAILAESNLEGTRVAVESMTGPNRAQALAGLARAWGKQDLNAAIEWAKKLPKSETDPDFDPNEIVRSAVYGKATVDPVAALEQLGSVPPGGRSGYFADTFGAKILKEASAADFDATVQWIAKNRGRLDHEALMGIAGPVTERLNADPATFLNQLASDGSLDALMPAINSALLNDGAGQRTAIWEWAKTQPESEAIKNLRRDVLNTAAYQEPDLALKLAKDLQADLTEDERQNVARALYNGGNMLHRFDGLMKDAPPFLREPLVQAAFESLSAETIGDPRAWIDRLAQLPEKSREMGLGSIARAWAGQSPEEAIRWVATQPSPDTRSQLLSDVISTWAYKDATSATDFVSSLPEGTERNRGTHSLVGALTEWNPQEAWRLALTINDPQQQKLALTGVITSRAMLRDPATARQWLESAPLDAQTKANLEARINSPANFPHAH
ncbi:MAG TPA: sigma-70 family RNA polymerase sigma factor [Verrucomicrobiae bacterium]